MENTILSRKIQILKLKRGIGSVILYGVMTAIAVFLIFPFVFMINRSFMTSAECASMDVPFFPSEWTIEPYKALFSKHNYLKYTLNTLNIIVVNIFTIPLAAALCAYGLTRIDFKGRKVVFAAAMSTLMIPGSIIQVPLYVLFANLGWTESNLPLIIPGMFGGGAVNIFLLMQFIRNVPKEIESAAMIDGAGVVSRFFKIVVPLCKPIILYLMVGTFTSCWSDFYNPLIYLKNADEYTLAIRIYYDCTMTNVAAAYANIRMAAGVFMSLLPAIIFLVYQRKLVDGIMIGAIKA